MSGTSEFYAAVYRLTARIPPGQAATYGQLAFLAGHPRASRIVGQAMARAPEGLPCHRVVYQMCIRDSLSDERSYLRGSFTLRCFQRLSRPDVATQLCPWQDNWCTRGLSIPVLSY